MKLTHPLKGLGPRVFVSYSFRDAEHARTLASRLSASGFQVSLEDETSLLGQELAEALPARIGGAEVFLPLLTSASNGSAWVRREYDWALARRRGGAGPLMLPVVLDKENLYGPVWDLSFVDATAGGLTDEVLSLVERACLGAVELLPLDEPRVYQFERPRAEALLRLEDPGRKRIISDSRGLLLAASDEVLGHLRGMDDPYAEDLLSREEKARRRVARRLALVDALMPKLIGELRHYFLGYAAEFPARAAGAVDRFGRLAVGREWLGLRERFHLIPEGSEVLAAVAPHLDAAAAEAGELGRGKPSDIEFGKMCWALGARHSTGARDFVEVGFDADPERGGLGLYFPASAIGPDWQLMLELGERPENTIHSYDWADFCTPQIALHCLTTADRFDTPLDEVVASVAWRLDEYRRMGFK